MGNQSFLYKVQSGSDGFQPRSLAKRLATDDRLALRWPVGRAPRPGDRIAIHLAGPSNRGGVYLKAVVASVDRPAEQVLVRATEFAVDDPLDDPALVIALAGLSASGYEHVFLVPEARSVVQIFSLGPTRRAKAGRTCALPLIASESLARPPRLSSDFAAFAPAFWVLPAGSFVYGLDGEVRREIEVASALCLRFKFGETRLADALAIGVYEALAARGLLRFDCVTPIPLSPDKVEAGKADRARSISVGIARLLGTRVLDLLSLKTAISKGALRRVGGLSAAEFEAAYAQALEVDAAVCGIERLLIVDDICHEGSTLSAALASIRKANRSISAVAAAAGQWASRDAVRDARLLLV